MLQSWSRYHALALLAAGAVAVLSSSSLPCVLAAAVSFSALLWACRGTYTPQGHFGVANGITALRFSILACLGIVPDRALGLALLAVLALDGLDGFVARRLESSSPFGAHFDMEVDAVLVAVASIELFRRGLAGPWVLSAGALRYAYVVCLWLWPARRGDAPRSRWGRLSFLLLMLGLSAPFLFGRGLGTPLAALGCAVVSLSFARSFYYSYV